MRRLAGRLTQRTGVLRQTWRFLRKLTRRPPVGAVDLGDLDRIKPVSTDWGFDRGQPVDRLYIEGFLEKYEADIKGHCLEVANNSYTLRFGGDRVTQSDILENENIPENEAATLVLDLVNTSQAPDERYDCIICTQTLHLIFDHRSALRTLHRMLKPGGVLLLTAPTITQISRWDADRHGDSWRYTDTALSRLVGEVFGAENLDVEAFGNVYAATAFLYGLAVEELDAEKLAHFDPDYQMLITVRAARAV